MPPTNLSCLFGAGNGTRTRDPELGRLALYQLSYSRLSPAIKLRLRYQPPLSRNTLMILHYVWWRGEDSNLRRRSPSDLQSDPFGHSGTSPPKSRSASRWSESNRRPTDYKSVALPTELHRQRAKEEKLFAGYHAVKNQPIQGAGRIRPAPIQVLVGTGRFDQYPLVSMLSSHRAFLTKSKSPRITLKLNTVSPGKFPIPIICPRPSAISIQP